MSKEKEPCYAQSDFAKKKNNQIFFLSRGSDSGDVPSEKSN